jgi:hypothetical protein
MKVVFCKIGSRGLVLIAFYLREYDWLCDGLFVIIS